jgi:hypothetical protein
MTGAEILNLYTNANKIDRKWYIHNFPVSFFHAFSLLRKRVAVKCGLRSFTYKYLTEKFWIKEFSHNVQLDGK